MARYLICGYYGYGNAGDEAILQAICARLSELDEAAEVCVLSASPRTTAAAFGVRSISRFSIRAFYSELRSADLFILGGGGLLQDATSSRSLIYYLATLVIAQLLGVQTMLLGNSVGPLVRRHNRSLVRLVLNKVAYVTVRDASSYRLIMEIGVAQNKCELLVDPVMMLHLVQGTARNDTITVALRDWRSESDYLAEIRQALQKLISLGHRIRFIPFHYERDLPISQRMADELGDGAECMTAVSSVADLLNALAESKVVIAMRLHALILATVVGTPMVGISYDPKVEGFLQSIEQDLVGCVESVRSQAIVDATLDAIERTEAIQATLSKHNARLVELAERNIEIAVDLACGRQPTSMPSTDEWR